MFAGPFEVLRGYPPRSYLSRDHRACALPSSSWNTPWLDVFIFLRRYFSGFHRFLFEFRHFFCTSEKLTVFPIYSLFHFCCRYRLYVSTYIVSRWLCQFSSATAAHALLLFFFQKYIRMLKRLQVLSM